MLHLGATLVRMPTTRPRITVTETPEVTKRLELAATRFPGRASTRAGLLLLLTEVAERALQDAAGDDGGRAEAKRRVLAETRAISPDDADAIIAARESEWQPELGA